MLAGPSTADPRSIFPIPGPSNSIPGSQSRSKPPTASAPAAPQTKSSRKQDGVSRELYNLIGPATPSLVAQCAKPRPKQKPNHGSSGATVVKWQWRAFKNNARCDGLQLGHWVKASTDPAAGYPFAKYNVSSQVYTYSQDEYTRLLEDKDWSKEETDYLFDLVKEYEMRFYIVADRYYFPEGEPRSIEDIKDRYFSVCRRLIRNRPWAGDESSRSQLISSFTFDKERELTRKKYIASLEGRTPEQIAEEEALYIEMKRLEQTERRFAKERDDLLRTLAGVDSGLANLGLDDDSHPMSTDTKKKKKGSIALDLDSPIAGPSQSPSASQTPVRRIQSAKSAAHDALHCIHRSDNVATVPATKAAHTPVYMRSIKLAGPKPALLPKVNQALAELDISHPKLVMPTRENCQQLEALFDATSMLLETKRAVERVDQEVRVLRMRLSDRGNAGRADAMDGEDASAMADTEGEKDELNGRASSAAVSIRSVSGRKRAQRSMSISSVDTSATSATRTSRKRQRN